MALVVVIIAVALASAGSGSSPPSAPGPARSASIRATSAAPLASEATRSVPFLALPASPLPRRVRVPILTWHRVAVFAREPVKSIPDETVEPSVFAAEMDALASHHYHPISQLQLYRALFQGAPLPPRPVLLTVDDGYFDDVRSILPILERHHFVATFYVITKRVHEPGFLDPGAIRKLDAAGMDIGAHTRHHVPLNAVSTAEMKNEIRGSRNDLELILGHPVQWFAYPFGAYDSAVLSVLRQAGFVLAVTTNAGTVESSLAPLTMPRIHVGRSDTAAGVLGCMTATTGACGGGGGG